MQARPARHFAVPPYRAELFSEKSGWSGVMNAHGVNCLTFPDKPGAVVTDYEDAQRIASEWNADACIKVPVIKRDILMKRLTIAEISSEALKQLEARVCVHTHHDENRNKLLIRLDLGERTAGVTADYEDLGMELPQFSDKYLKPLAQTLLDSGGAV